ncbi:MAG: hypothetical protein H7279_03005 [Microbacteriaceae bacterium]|nr:hypothetical protein [Microbacteriaceae bacterium]
MMVNTTPLDQNPKDDEPEQENSTTPIAAEEAPHDTAPAESDASVPVLVSAQPTRPVWSKPGLILAGGIVAAVLVLGGTFSGGVLLGSSVSSNHGITDARQGLGDGGARGGPGHQGGHQGRPGHQEDGRQGGPGSDSGPGSRDSTNGGTTNGGTGTGVNPTPAPGTGQGNAPLGGTNGSTGSTNG